GGWADPAPRFFDHASVGPRLQLVPVRPVPGRDFLPLPVVLDPSFHFALARSVARQAGIDVKANRLRVTSIAGVELTPRTGSTHHRRLLVIHSHCRRNPLEATKCLIVDLVPRELILARRPDSRTEAAMAEPKVELVCGDTPSRDLHLRPHRPVRLGLSTGRGLDAPTSASRRLRVDTAIEPLHRAKTSRVVVLADQPIVQRRQVDRCTVRV